MVNTMKRRRSTRIESCDNDSNSPPHNTTFSISLPTSYHHQPSSDTQNQPSFPAMIEPEGGNSPRLTRHQLQSHSHSHIPETLPPTNPVTSTTSAESQRTHAKSWFLANYKMVGNAKATIPRSDIFEHYRHSCSLANIEPVNDAMIGKVIRSTFSAVKTRRLGHRGHSKYQYTNIQRLERPETDRYHLFTELPPANPVGPRDHQQQGEEELYEQQCNERLGTITTGILTNFDSNPNSSSSSSTTRDSTSKNDSLHSIHDAPGFPSNRLPPPIMSTSSTASHLSSAPRLGDLLSDLSVLNKSCQRSHTHSSLSRSDTSTSIASSSTSTTQSYTVHLNDDFAIYYNKHCLDLYNAICKEQFDQIQIIYESFYYNMPTHYKALLNDHKMIDAVWRWDCLLYDTLIVNILPEVNTFITKPMMSGLIQFTRTLPKFLTYLLQDYSATFQEKKYDVASLFVAKIRHHLTLNHFANAASDMLRQLNSVETMKADWKKLDLGAIQDSVFWMCDCENDIIYQTVEQDILRLLDGQNILKNWITWVENLIDKYLPNQPKTQENVDIDEYMKTGKQFMMKWKLYTGLIMQEFYAMNAFSADSWKTLQRFLDDLVLYHVQERIAKMNSNISKIRQVSQIPFTGSNGLLNTNQDN